ncbi:DUF6302 family protein [Streptomyces mirabilis]|uniref:DUF6302 family protein n=1 Tax=Streptomyces mirabilis TaxID=68239 RepID=UPI0033BC3A38
MTNHRTKREIAANRGMLVAQKATVIRRYTYEGASMAALCRDYGVGIGWLRRQFDVWDVPRRPRGRTAHAAVQETSVDERERAALARRLAEPGLLEQSVVLDLSSARVSGAGVSRLAVPVGGVRVAGEVTVGNWGEALIVILQLEADPGRFPRVRQRKPLGSPWEPRTICWGAPTPVDDWPTRGCMFGYHEAGVIEYTAAHAQSSAPLGQR